MARVIMLEVEDEVSAFVATSACVCRVCRKKHEAAAPLHGLRAKHPDGHALCFPYCPACAPLGTSYEDMMRREIDGQIARCPITFSFQTKATDGDGIVFHDERA